MKKSLISFIYLILLTGVALAQTTPPVKNDTGPPPSGVSPIILIIGLVVVLGIGYFLFSRSKKS